MDVTSVVAPTAPMEAERSKVVVEGGGMARLAAPCIAAEAEARRVMVGGGGTAMVMDNGRCCFLLENHRESLNGSSRFE